MRSIHTLSHQPSEQFSFRPLIVGCLTVATLAGGASHAEPPAAAENPLRPYFVGEVVVTSDQTEPTEASGDVEVLESEEIRESGATTVAEALETMTGVFGSTGARNEHRIWLRGYGQSEVLVMVDGVPIADPYSGEVDLGQIPVHDVARIVVSRGGASPIYGPNGLGGVINIVTFQGERGRVAEAAIRFSDNNTSIASGAVGGMEGALDWYFGAGLRNSDGFNLSDDFTAQPYQPTGRRVNADGENSSFSARVGFELGPRDRVTASVRWVDAEKGIPFHTTRPTGFIKFSRFSEWRQGTAALGWERNTKWGTNFRAQIFSHRYDNTLDVFADPELESLILRSTFEDRVFGGFLIGERAIGRHFLSGAFHLRQDNHRRIESEDGPSQLTEDYTSLTGSAALEGRFDLGLASSLIVGLGVDHHEMTDAWTVQGGDLENSSETILAAQTELRKLVHENTVGSLSVYRRTRFPTMQELFGGATPNPALKPEIVTGANLSLRWQPAPSVSLRGALYFDRVEEIISRIGRTFPYENHDEAEISGFELSARGQAGLLDYRATATIQSAEFTSSAQGMTDIPLIPESTADLGLGLRLGTATHFRTSWQWVGERPYYDWDELKTLKDYSLLRFTLIRTWTDFELSLELENALDDDVEQEWGYPLPGRRLWVGVTYRVTRR